MAAIIFLLVSLVSLGHFTDFILGKSGQIKVKDQLTAIYVAVSDGDWSLLFRAPARSLLDYIDTILPIGKPIVLCVRLLFYSLGFSLLVDALLLISHAPTYPSLLIIPLSPDGVGHFEPLFLFGSILNNLPFDAISVVLVRWLARLLLNVGAIYIVPILLFFLSLALLIFGLAAVSQNFILVMMYSIWYQIFPSFDIFKAAYLAALATYSTFEWRSMLPCIQVVIPITTFVLFCTASYAMYLSRNLVKKPMLTLLERLDESKSGIFTSFASVISAVIALLAALGKWIGS